MGIFSEELLWLDRNTTQYMIDEMQDTIDEMKGTISGMEGTIKEQQQQLEEVQLIRKSEHKQNLFTLIRQIRNLTAKGISPSECAELLAADEHLVRTVCRLMQEQPDAGEDDIHHLLIKEEAF